MMLLQSLLPNLSFPICYAISLVSQTSSGMLIRVTYRKFRNKPFTQYMRVVCSPSTAHVLRYFVEFLFLVLLLYCSPYFY